MGLMWGFQGLEVGRVLCEVGCEHRHPKAGCVVVGGHGTVKSGRLGGHILHRGPSFLFALGLQNNLRGHHKVEEYSPVI